jgi:hypothetical protein
MSSLTFQIALIVYPAIFAWIAAGIWVSHTVSSRYGLARWIFLVGILGWPVMAAWLAVGPILRICGACRRAVAGRVVAQTLEEDDLTGYDRVTARKLQTAEPRATSGTDLWGDDHL